MKKSKKKWTIVAITLASIATLSATFAWLQSQDNAKNHFEGSIAGNDVEVVETFTPPTNWIPGQEINKDVAVLNTGNYRSMIRVSFSEILKKLENPESKTSSDTALLNNKTKEQLYLVPFNDSALKNGDWTDANVVEKTFTVTGGEYSGTYVLKVKEQSNVTNTGTTYRYVSYWENGTTKYYAKVSSYERTKEGVVTPSTAEFKYIDLAPKSLIFQAWGPNNPPQLTIDSEGKATVKSASDSNILLNFVNLSETPMAGKWFYNTADGCFYYISIVNPQEQTAQLLDSVTLSDRADNSYSMFTFDLEVFGESIQAAKESVNSISWVNNSNSVLKDALEGLYSSDIN